MGTREDRPVKDSPAHGNGERLDTVFMYRHSGWWTLLFIPPTGIIVNFHGEKNNRERVSPMLFVKLVRYENTYFLFRFISSTTQIWTGGPVLNNPNTGKCGTLLSPFRNFLIWKNERIVNREVIFMENSIFFFFFLHVHLEAKIQFLTLVFKF